MASALSTVSRLVTLSIIRDLNRGILRGFEGEEKRKGGGGGIDDNIFFLKEQR